MQRTRGSGRLSVPSCLPAKAASTGCSRRALPASVAPVPPGSPLEAVIINTAGGLTGGDHMDWQFEAGEGARMSLTTQACEKTYKARATEARVSVQFRLQSGSSMAWLPQETILFDRARLTAQHRCRHGG
jgi:urease accessory protein